MTVQEFKASLPLAEPPGDLSDPLAALWWDAKGDRVRAHGMVDDLLTRHAMAVHAYLHRKEGEEWNADYWYGRAGRTFHRPTLEAEWQALVEGRWDREFKSSANLPCCAPARAKILRTRRTWQRCNRHGTV